MGHGSRAQCGDLGNGACKPGEATSHRVFQCKHTLQGNTLGDAFEEANGGEQGERALGRRNNREHT